MPVMGRNVVTDSEGCGRRRRETHIPIRELAAHTPCSSGVRGVHRRYVRPQVTKQRNRRYGVIARIETEYDLITGRGKTGESAGAL